MVAMKLKMKMYYLCTQIEEVLLDVQWWRMDVFHMVWRPPLKMWNEKQMSPTANPVLASIRHTEYHSQNSTLFMLSRIICPGCNCNKNFWPLYLTHTLGLTVSIVLHMISKYNPFFNWTSLSLFLFPPVHCSSCVMKHKWMMTQSLQTVSQHSSVLYQWGSTKHHV